MHTVIGSTAAFSLNDFKARAVASARDVFSNDARQLDPRAESFLEQLQDDAIAEDLAGLTIDDVIALAASLWSWASAREPSETRVRGGVGRGAGGRELAREVIEIVADDKPFLVDSVMGEVNAQGHDVLAMFHPIVPPTTEEGPETSIIQVHLDVLSELERERLVSALQSVLADVEITVADHTAMRASMDRAIVELQRAKTTASPDELAEAIAFLEWLRDDHFAFLGGRAYEFLTDGKGGFIRDEPEIVPGSELGLLRDHDRHVLRRGSEPVLITSAVEEFLREPSPVIVAKSNMRSRVHRRAHMDYVGVKRYDERGEVKGETRFVGLFTAAAYHVRVREVPLIRRKVRRVIERAVRSRDGHSEKQLASILETYPRDELFQMTEDEILDIARGVLHVFDRPRTKLFIRRDRFDRFLSILAYIPRDRFNSQLREKIGETIALAFGGRVSAYYPYFGAGALARVHFIIGLDPDHPEPDIAGLEAAVVELARTWEDEFVRVARLEAPSKLRPRLPSYENAFSAGYREAFTPEEALDDALAIESIDPIVGLGVRAFRDPADEPRSLRLKVYHEGGEIALSDVMPTLEAMGLHVQSETSHAVRRAPAGEGDAPPPVIWVHEFKVLAEREIDLEAIKTPFEDAFIAIWTGATESDGFNRLVLELGASWREVCFLRAC
ncbi:MAG: NAD-glutamate dehydrogenase, partial [Maricaulaceae bacterium]